MRPAAKTLLVFAGFVLQAAVHPLELISQSFHKSGLFGMSQAFAEVLERVEDVLKRNFPAADSFKEEVKKLDDAARESIREKSGVVLTERQRRFFFHIANNFWP